jgi:hypothetical protein
MAVPRRAGDEAVDDCTLDKLAFRVEDLCAYPGEDLERDLVSGHEVLDRTIDPELQCQVVVIQLGLPNQVSIRRVRDETLSLDRKADVRIRVLSPLRSVASPEKFYDIVQHAGVLPLPAHSIARPIDKPVPAFCTTGADCADSGRLETSDVGAQGVFRVVRQVLDWVFKREREEPDVPLCSDHHTPMQLRGYIGRPARFTYQQNESYTVIYYCPVQGCNETAERELSMTQIPVPEVSPRRPDYSRRD